jgi:hypothetical protein
MRLKARFAAVMIFGVLFGLVDTQLAASRAGAQPASTIEFGDKPLRIDSVGLTCMVPLGATIQQAGGVPNNTVGISDPDGRWLMYVRTPKSSDLTLTTDAVADSALRQLLGHVGVLDPKQENVVSTRGTVIYSGRSVSIPSGAVGQRFAVLIPSENNRSGRVTAYTVFKASAGQFITFELATDEKSWPEIEPVYYATVATAKFEDPKRIDMDRRASVEMGEALFDRLTPEDYEAAISANHERWYRLYVPPATGADSDAQEVAYRRMTAWKGSRGELDPTKQRGAWSPMERQEGYLVRLEVRSIEDSRNGIVIDTVGTYFMTADRENEDWVLTSTRRGKTIRTSSYTERGVRKGQSMQIQTYSEGRPARSVRPLLQGRGYVCQVEVWILSDLLARGQAEGDYAFYAYNSASERITLRRDDLSRAPDNPDLWKLVSKLSEDADPQVTLMRSDGHRIRTTLADGTAWEPTTKERLYRLWKDQGLPTE